MSESDVPKLNKVSVDSFCFRTNDHIFEIVQFEPYRKE